MTSKIVLLDGAMGTMLQASGALQPGEAPELLNLTNPQAVSAVHQAYCAVGADCLTTNTFGGNRLKLEANALADRIQALNTTGVALARQAAGSEQLVAASVGPTGHLLEPLGDLSFDQAYQTFLEQAQILKEAGADLILAETFSDLLELKAALQAARQLKIPVIAAVSFLDNGRLLTGATPAAVAASLSGLPVVALGTNCGLTAAALGPIVSILATYSNRAVLAQPNAGKPALKGSQTVYQESPAQFAQDCLKLVQTGAGLIGGCCGTTPEHIAELRRLLNETAPVPRSSVAADYLAGKSTVLEAAPNFKTAASWRLILNPENQLWQEFSQGANDQLLTNILELDPEVTKLIEIDGRNLNETDNNSWQQLITTIATYWANPLAVRVHRPSLVETFLKYNPGRGLVIAPNDPQLRQIVSDYGGIFQLETGNAG